MKRILISTLLFTSVFNINVQASSLTQVATQQQSQERAHNVKRESEFKKAEADLRSEKKARVTEKRTLQKQIDKLAKQFSHNEDKLAKAEEKLRLESGSLGEVFGVVRQNAKEFKAKLEGSVATADHHQYEQVIHDIVSAKSLPSLSQLNALWLALADQVQASREIGPTEVAYVNHAGEIERRTVIRIGNLALVGDSGYLSWNAQNAQATPYRVQPESTPTRATLTPLLSGQTQYVTIDPSRGALIAQLENEPTLMDRLKAGGVIGNIIIGLLVIGLMIGIFRGVTLSINKQKISKQLKNPHLLGNNPLARVLRVYKKEEVQTVEALELRLLEAVLDEQSQLEKGLSMLKLLAALAPMLGLLGTVTGMIETFQVITLFGNGDPKVMAGGISMALVTTVLGLVAAMPLLLAHNILSSQAETIRNILEKQGIGLVAAQAEADSHNKLLEKAA